MTKLEKLLTEAKVKIDNLNFEDCIKLHDSIPKGNAMHDLVYNRMEVLDLDRFDTWLDGKLGL